MGPAASDGICHAAAGFHKSCLSAVLVCVLLVMYSCFTPVDAGTETFHLSLPNTETGIERVLGLGIAFPHPYYQRPRHRYPVYDSEGRGSLVYGYGGNEVYPYRVFDPVEGIINGLDTDIQFTTVKAGGH